MQRTVVALSMALAIGGFMAPSVRAETAGKLEPLPTIAAQTETLKRMPGLIDLFLDTDQGRVLALLPQPDANTGHLGRYIYAARLRRGLGSNPVGLDRGAGGFGNEKIVRFVRHGRRVVLEAENLRFRALTDNPEERQAVAESFATSILWSTPIIAQNPASGRVLIDLSSLLTTDTVGIADRLKAAGQGSFKTDLNRSFPIVDESLTFPKNVELEAALTFAAADPGREVRETAPEPKAVSLILHHSFVALPEPGYKPRLGDPRSGSIEVSFFNFSAPLDGPVRTRFARRFRLQKADPSAPKSDPIKPIVFYLDRGTPEPVRSALLEGARWWAEAYEAAGFTNAFRVEMLPEDAHPLDVRYNYIQWTHRQTRGWSYGGGLADPRTGEMLKAFVTLGSQRVRHDRMIFEGLAGTAKTGTGAPDDPVMISLARLRQLSAHEVGHTIGLRHNFAASTQGRASVMDYPAPVVIPTDQGTLDFSNAYGVGVGAWDVFAIRWLYSEAAPGTDETAMLEAIMADVRRQGLRYVTDAQARPAGGAHPYGSLWDNGGNPVEELDRVMRVRRIALDGFGTRALKKGRALHDLRRVLVPIYLYHRYQVAAAAKWVGGYEFSYGVNGAAAAPGMPVPPEGQNAAIAALLKTLDPAELDLPDAVLNVLAPSPYRGQIEFEREVFSGNADPVFDTLGAADTAATLTISMLLAPERLTRLAAFHHRDARYPGVSELLTRLSNAAFNAVSGEPDRLRMIRHRVQARLVTSLMKASLDTTLSVAVRSKIDLELRNLRQRLTDRASVMGGMLPEEVWLSDQITKHFERPAPAIEAIPKRTSTPPGSPIGGSETCWHCE